MDHGADCINSGLSYITYAEILGSDSTHFFVGVFTMQFLSHVIFLEEYFTGRLDFPEFNFVNEGITLMFVNLIPGILFGNSIYAVPIVAGIRFLDVIFVGSFVTVLFQLTGTLRNVSSFTSVGNFFANKLLMLYLGVVHLLVYFCSDNWLFVSYPKIPLYFAAFMTSRVIISMMIAHVLEIPFVQFQRYPLMIITAQLGVFIFEKVFLKVKTDANQMIVAVAYSLVSLVSFLYLAVYCYSMVSNIAKILGIEVFSIAKKVSVL